MPVESASPTELEAALRRRVLELEASLTAATEALMTTAATLSSTSAELQSVRAERDKLRRAYELLKGQLELLRRRIFLAQAERIDTSQLELEFAETKAKLAKMATELGDGANAPDTAVSSGESTTAPAGSERPKRARTSKGSGRPNLRELDLPEERVEIFDPALNGKAEVIGFEETCFLGRRRGGAVRIVLARATYKKATDDERTEIVTAEKPKEVYERGMLAPSFIAYLLTKKFRWGMPFHRLALELASEGISLDDSTMCRYAEHVGATLGCVVDAMAKEAREKAFCLSTDATGVAIQPNRLADGKRQPCAKGHFFVVLADKDHLFFEYQAKHTSEAVCSMFRGFKGYIQADAHCVYDALFRGEARIDESDKPPDEVACWAHARENSGRPPSRPKSRRPERRSSGSGCSSRSKRTGPISRQGSDTTGGSASRARCSTIFSHGPRASSSACAACAGPSPARSATPSGNATRSAATSTTAGCASRTTPPSAP